MSNQLLVLAYDKIKALPAAIDTYKTYQKQKAIITYRS